MHLRTCNLYITLCDVGRKRSAALVYPLISVIPVFAKLHAIEHLLPYTAITEDRFLIFNTKETLLFLTKLCQLIPE